MFVCDVILVFFLFFFLYGGFNFQRFCLEEEDKECVGRDCDELIKSNIMRVCDWLNKGEARSLSLSAPVFSLPLSIINFFSP